MNRDKLLDKIIFISVILLIIVFFLFLHFWFSKMNFISFYKYERSFIAKEASITCDKSLLLNKCEIVFFKPDNNTCTINKNYLLFKPKTENVKIYYDNINCNYNKLKIKVKTFELIFIILFITPFLFMFISYFYYYRYNSKYQKIFNNLKNKEVYIIQNIKVKPSILIPVAGIIVFYKVVLKYTLPNNNMIIIKKIFPSKKLHLKETNIIIDKNNPQNYIIKEDITNEDKKDFIEVL